MTRPGWLECHTDGRERARFVEAFAAATADLVQSRWPNAEGPDETVSRYTGCPATQG